MYIRSFKAWKRKDIQQYNDRQKDFHPAWYDVEEGLVLIKPKRDSS